MIDFTNQLSCYDLAVDLGTSNFRIIARGKGLVVREPTVVSRQRKKGGVVLAVGKKAKAMMGKEPQQIEIVEPISEGVIADFDAALNLIDHFFSLVRQIPGRRLKIFGPRVIAGVSSKATEVERRAVKAAMLKAGAREVFLVEKPMAAAVGMDISVDRSSGFLVIDIGGGTTEIAVISLGGIVLNRSISVGGNTMDEAIVNFLRLKYGLLIGQPTAERVKNELGCIYPTGKENKKQLVIRGRDLESGLPKSVKISQQEVMEALVPVFQKIVTQLSELLEELPAELTNDILKGGIGLTGGVSQISGLEKYISEETKMPAWLAESPFLSVVKGGSLLLEDRKLLDKVKLVSGLK
jgi:rod shape-determining protein MreB and related proteins